MGVKLREIVESNTIDAKDLMNCVIAVDAPNIISALLGFKNKSQNVTYMTDRSQRVISHLYGLLYRVSFFYSKGILPVFCFDGRDSELKRKVTKDLLKDFNYADVLYREAIENKDEKTARNIALGKEYLWLNVLKESRALLGAMGVPVIESPASAEAQCAHLVSSKIATFANSQDYDTLVFGCPHIVQNLSKSKRRKLRGKWIYEKVNTCVIDLNSNLRFWGINKFQLVDIAILVGNDYFSGVQNIAVKTALSLIKKHGCLEEIVRMHREKYDFSHLTKDILKKVRQIFLFPDVVDPVQKIHWNAPDYSRASSLLCEDHNLNRERVEKAMVNLSKFYDKCLENFKNIKKAHSSFQKPIDAYFNN